MSNFKTPRLNEDDVLSQSSDEKMDTGSESFRSQGTPNSVLSSDFDDRSLDNVLRLQNPENAESETELNEVLRLSKPDNEDNKKNQILSDSFVTKMSNLNIDSPRIENRPRNLGISPPKSSLVLTTNHPLMGLNSPDDYPDLIPKKVPKEDDKELSLSSIEDDRANETNGYDFYSPERNTSKNNLYFSEIFTTADSQVFGKETPDVARVEKERRKIIPRFTEKRELDSTPQRFNHFNHSSMRQDFENVKDCNKSTPKYSVPIEIPETEYRSEVTEWCESPSHLRSIPNFELPIELSTNIINNDLESPDVVSSSTQEDKSAYQALLDPYTGSVALRPTVRISPGGQRRKIQLPPDDRCSLDSVSVSMDSEEEPPEPELQPEMPEICDVSDDEAKRSRSTNTMSECSDPIPEYSAAEELREERSWLTVRSGGADVTCDMKVIEPYKRVLSHGGYDARGSAIIVFSACHLPDNARPDYRYVMGNLFLYVIWTVERLVTEEYVVVYLHGSAGSRRMPTFRWLLECYRLVDRRLRKSLKHLYMVHPTFWLKAFVMFTKPFISSKFFRKLSYVRSLPELFELVPVEPNAIPEVVREFDARR